MLNKQPITYGVEHAVYHKEPMQPTKRKDTQQENYDETAKRISVNAD